MGPSDQVDDGWRHLIERINARGALIKVLDKPHLDLTTPLGRGVIRLPIGNGRVKKSPTDQAAVSSSSQTALEKSISRVTPDKNGSTRAPQTRPCREARLKFGRMLAPGGTALPADQMPTCSRVFEATATAL
jgi:hypothetical protein